EVLEALKAGGAMFFGELVRQTRLLPSRVEQALAELTAQGAVTADSFEGLRALLVPQEKRVAFADTDRKRRHKAVTSVEYAGRWSLLRNGNGVAHGQNGSEPSADDASRQFHDAAVESQ